jgi:hypothetical protein
MFADLEASHLVDVIWVSLVAGVSITVAFSFVVLGSARHAEARRARHRGAAIAYGALAGVALIAFAAAVVLAVQIMLSK